MSHTKLQKAFKKLHHQAQVILSEENTPSRIEKDYLKQLTIQFYDALMSEESEPMSEFSLKDLRSTMQPERKEIKKDTSRPIQKIEKPEPVETPIQAKPTVDNTPAPEPVAVQETAAAAERIEIEAEVEIEDTAYAELFAQAQSGDLSDRLSQRPIENITKAMGVNERIFMTNELFNGDSDAFQKHLSELNKLNDFDSAKRYMIAEIINEYDWVNESKANQAKDFIKLVRRRHPQPI